MQVVSSLPTSKKSIDTLEIKEGLEGLNSSRIIMLYRRAPLFRPASDPQKVWQMFEKSSLVLTAWHDRHLVGVARVLTDGVLNSYLCDLAVEPDVQRLGVGKELINAVIERCKGTDLVLRDSDISTGFYARLGFKRVANAWVRNCR